MGLARTAARRARAGLMCGLALTMPLSAAQAQDGSASAGLAYAQRQCAGCHGVEADRTLSPVLGIATFKDIANTPGMTAMALKVWFQSPHPNMPNLVLAPDDRDNVVAYITGLRERK